MIRIGLCGFGKIARDQHVPAIAATSGVELVAVADPFARAEEVPSFSSLAAMLAAEPEIDAVAMCQPPQFRFAAAREALLAGKHVFLEKPPGMTLSEVEALVELAQRQGVSLFSAWHSREASGVAPAREWLAGRRLEKVFINWKEDVRVWHPGQAWIWQPGGFGVFDPGINALSLLTAVLPEPVRLTAATLEVPANCAAPIAANLTMETASGVPIAAEFDFRQEGPQSWDIVITAEDSELCLSHGGNGLTIDGVGQPLGEEREYRALYARFAEVVAARGIAVDLAPLRLVADAFMSARTISVEPFVE